MSERETGQEDLAKLAEEVMSEKRDEVGGEDRARELWDVPTESPGTLAEQQKDDA